MTDIKARNLRLGDTIRYNSIGAYGDYMVEKLKETGDKDNPLIEITAFRPYAHHGNLSHTGGVICYVGIENWTFVARPYEIFEVVKSGGPLK